MKRQKFAVALAVVCILLIVRQSGGGPRQGPSAQQLVTNPGHQHAGPEEGGSSSSGPKKTRGSTEASQPSAGMAIKVAHKTWRYADNGGIGDAAVQAAIEAFSDKNSEIDFADAKPGEPLPVQDECRGNNFFLVPLEVDGEYAGVVLMKAVGDHEVRRSVVRPGAGALTEPLSTADPDISSPEFEQAYLTEAQASAFAEQEGHTLQGAGTLTIACAGSYPLAPPTTPFYSFPTIDGRVLVSSVTGDVVTQEELGAFQAANEALGASFGRTEIEE